MTDAPAENPYRFTPAAASPAEGDQIALRALRVTAFEYCDDLFWREDDGILSVMVNCSDVFFWGCADAEELTVDNIDLFEATFTECQERFGKYDATYASELFVARHRGTRPQGAYYKYLDPEWAKLFNAAGPERDTGVWNPLTPEQAQAHNTTEQAPRNVGDTGTPRPPTMHRSDPDIITDAQDDQA